MSTPRLRIALVDIGGSDTSALAPALEAFGCRPLVYRVGRGNDLVGILSGEDLWKDADHLILDCHGQDGRIAMPYVHPSVVEPGEPTGDWGPERVREHAKLPPLLVMSTGCSTGSPELARAFLDAGCRAYIGPDDYPNGAVGLFCEIHFYYQLLYGGLGEREALARATAQGGDAAMYRWYER